MSVVVAAARYAVGEPSDFDAFAERVFAQVAQAAGRGAGIIVLPEYLGVEPAAALDPAVRIDFARSLAALQSIHRDYVELFRSLARRHRAYLVAGSFLLDVGAGRYRNRAYFAAPNGAITWQDKLCLTGFERAAGMIEPGDALKVFDTDHGRVAIEICYDIEFPLHARAQVEAGARMILVPSCTDTEAGANRVRYGCQSRAMENQVYVTCSVTAGELAWSPALDTNTGEAGIYTPVDRGFPSDGVQVRGTDAWAIAELDLDALDRFKRDAQVGIHADWPAQQRPSVVRAVVERFPAN